ncbi:uncharacterized protein A4U43_C05F30840 [Asparagus officinalis]|uniref:Uncharacterized protein n=1 Tax=Asparagus officinalis TaxID=4686 RepID=A0A5P1EVQ2_ASPOF|nr:uncharacterized protein A4U43_C05F30840 [Asparagus officinalis]
MTPFEAVYGIPPLRPVAYKLALPPGSQVHDVFRVSLLKKHLRPFTPTSTQLSPVSEFSTILPQPEAVLNCRVIQKAEPISSQSGFLDDPLCEASPAMMQHPALPRSRQISRPMPDDAPVTITTCPSSFSHGFSISNSLLVVLLTGHLDPCC